MSHEVYEIDGKASMAFTGNVPWHGLGQQVDPDAPIDVWKREACFEWHVKEAPVLFFREARDEVLEPSSFDAKKVLYRSDDGKPLSVVSSRYCPVQPETVLEFFRNLVDVHGFKIVTAGSLRRGARIWALASINQEARIGNKDIVKPYVLLTTSYDGTMATTAQFTSVHVVCNNTLSFSYSEGEKDEAKQHKNPGKFMNVVRVSHHAQMTDAKIHEVQAKLGLAGEAFYQFAETLDRLSNRRVTQGEVANFFTTLLHDPRNGEDFSDVPPRVSKALARTYTGGQGQDIETRSGTAWGLVGAVTRYVDHERGFRSPDTRMNYAWFGQGEALKNRAMSLAKTLL